jgi:eukaryotic-like serine/threonine-protein kinase
MSAHNNLKEYASGATNVHTTGRYQIICSLGQGASGIVYLAWDPTIRRNVALKVSQAGNHEFRELFLSEAQSAGRLNHPNIVAVYDAGAENDLCFIAMEYIKGTTLESYSRKETLLPPNRGLEILLDVCKGLDYAHHEGVIHRDIKPSNILLNCRGCAKITDFGVAQMTDKTFAAGIRGTPHYLSPEQIKGELVSFQSDIFSLGCVLYELLCGEKAFPGENSYGVFYKITTAEPVPILSLRKDLPKVLDEVIRRAIRKEPKDRYHSCMELAYDLTVALRSVGIVPRKQENIQDVVDYLHNLSFFADFKVEQLHELASMANVIKVSGGKVVASEGDIDDTFYIILSGRAKVRKGGVDIATIGSGECFGEMSLLGGQPRVANVRAETDCILMKITASLLQQLPESIALLFYRSFAKTLVRRLSHSLEEKDGHGQGDGAPS